MATKLIVSDAEYLDEAGALCDRAERLRASLLRLSALVTSLYESDAIDGPAVRAQLKQRSTNIARFAEQVPKALASVVPSTSDLVREMGALDDFTGS